MSARVDLEYASNVLVDAIALGDTSAAKKWGLNRRTIQRYRVHSREWPELAEMVRQKNAEVTHDLATLRVQFLRDALQELRKKLPEGSIYEVTGAIKIVGELHATAMMIGDDVVTEADPVGEPDVESKDVSSAANGSTDARH